MVRRGGRARLQKQGGMLAALDNGDQDAPQPMPMDSHLRRKENIHSNKPVPVKIAASPQKEWKPEKGNELPSKQQKASTFQPFRASPPKPVIDKKATESPHRRECSPLNICSPSAPLTSVEINLQNDSADGDDDYEPIRRDLFESPLSIASAFSRNSSTVDPNTSADNEHGGESESREENSPEIKTTLSNQSNVGGSHLSNNHSKDDGEYSDNSESDDEDLDGDESFNSQSSQSESGSENNDLESSENRYDENILREYEEETDEDYSVHVESESDDEFEFDADSCSSEGKKLTGKKRKEGQEEKRKANKAINDGKLKRNKSKSVRRTEKDDASTESKSSQSNDSEGTADGSVRNPKTIISKTEADEMVHDVVDNGHVEDKRINYLDSVMEDKSNSSEPAHQMNSSASYISNLQHTRIQCSKSSKIRLWKTASTTEPCESEVLEIVDQLFKMIVDKDSVTVGDIIHSVAQHFGLSKVKKDTKKAIRARLTELIQADEDGAEFAATKATQIRKEQRVISRERGTGEDMQQESRSAGVRVKDDTDCVVDKDNHKKPYDSGEPQQSTGFETFDSSKHPSDSNVIGVVDQLFETADSDTVFLSEIVRAVAKHFGLDKVKKDMKQLIKARFVELINATQNTTEEVDQHVENTGAALADHSTIESGFNQDIDVPFVSAHEASPPSAYVEPEAEHEGLQVSFDEAESAFVVDYHIHDKGTNIAHTPMLDPKSPSFLMSSTDSRCHSLAGEHLKFNESFTSVETTLFKNLSPERVKSNDNDSIDNLMSSLSISNSISDTSEVRRVEKGKWSLGNEIGSGSFGVVHVGMNAVDGSLMAIKVLRIPSTNKRVIVDELQREIDLMRSLKHQNIVRYLGAEVDTSNNILNIFQEWVPGGSVSSLLKKFGPFSFAVVKSYATQILKGLDYLHSNHIIHRDIKGGNILVSNDGCVKLADFGASKRVEAFGIDPDRTMEELTVRGTPYFMAPEVFEERYGPKADIWSVGGVIYQMATGSPPWKDLGHKNPISLFFHLKSTDDPPKFPPSTVNRNDEYSLSLLEKIISKCFQRDPSKRPNASTLLKDTFFSSHTVISDSAATRNVDTALRSPPAVTSSPTASAQTNETDHNTGLSDSLCYSLTLPVPIHFDRSLNTEIDISDWPDWAKESYQLSCLHNERVKANNKTIRNPFSRSVGRT